MGKGRAVLKSILSYGVGYKNKGEEFRDIIDMNADEYPQMCNAKGEEMMLYYLQDKHCAHHPWTLSYGRIPTQVYWDRYNWRLKYHLYTGMDALKTKGTPIKKFALLKEAEIIAPETYKLFRENRALCGEFNKIFTFSEELLNSIENARFVPASTVWVGTQRGGGTLDPLAYEKKTRMISMIASHKVKTPNQIIRVNTAKKLKRLGIADTYGMFDGGERFEFVADALTDYRYQVVVENESCAYTFTEKLFNCLATMTVPVYYGAEKVGEYFNTDGMIILKKEDFDDIDKIVKKCTEELYKEKIEAIKDNYERVKQFLSIEDFMFEKYREDLKV